MKIAVIRGFGNWTIIQYKDSEPKFYKPELEYIPWRQSLSTSCNNLNNIYFPVDVQSES